MKGSISKQPRALVIGGSIGGLLAAHLLRTIGWDVTIFERAGGDLADRGAGIGAHAALFAVMQRIGIRLGDAIGVEVRSRICLDRSGDMVCEVPLRGVTSAWDRIYRALKNALPPECLRFGMRLERFEQDGRRVTALLSDGSQAEGDLLIGADGIHSTVRRQLMPDQEPGYAGYVAWRGVVEKGKIPASLHRLIFRHMAFCFPANELAFSVPMAGMDEGAGRSDHRCQFVWFRPADYKTALPSLCTDASGRRHGVSIPPPLIRPELVGELRARAKLSIAPQIATLVALAPRPILQPVFDLESPQMVFERVVLLGDAAFVARPHVGTGVTKAALDAQCLVDSLAGSVDLGSALARYNRERHRFGKWLVARGRYLGSHLEPNNADHQPVSHKRTEVLIREYGAAGVIDGEPISARLY